MEMGRLSWCSFHVLSVVGCHAQSCCASIAVKCLCLQTTMPPTAKKKEQKTKRVRVLVRKMMYCKHTVEFGDPVILYAPPTYLIPGTRLTHLIIIIIV